MQLENESFDWILFLGLEKSVYNDRQVCYLIYSISVCFFFLLFFYTCAHQRAISENIMTFVIMLSKKTNSYGTDIECVVNIGNKSIQYMCYSK